jgi:hypothetical protein
MKRAYGIKKVRCYGKHIGNPLGTWREHIGNQGKLAQKNLSSTPQNLKRGGEKKQGTLSGPSPLATWNFLLPKEFVTIFGPG